MSKLRVLDLFSAAAGGWSLGMHRAGFKTIAACENVAWRRSLYQENNPHVRIYDDVCTLTADQLFRDFGFLPDIIVGSPPCQDISSANTKGKGVEGERSGLYFEAVRIIGEVRPRWFALENSANLRTRGADSVFAALEALGYACWAFVVGAGDIGANHERARSWLIGFDPEQVADADGFGRNEGWRGRWSGIDVSVSNDLIDATGQRHEGRRTWRHGQDGDGSSPIGPGHVCKHNIRWPWACWECEAETPYPEKERCVARAGDWQSEHAALNRDSVEHRNGDGLSPIGNAPHANETGCWSGQSGNECPEASARSAAWGTYAPSDARIGDGNSGFEPAQMGRSESVGVDTAEPWADWNGGPAQYLRVDVRLRAWAFLAILLDEGGFRWAGEKLILALKSASGADVLLRERDIQTALKTALDFQDENTARNLAPIAEKLSADCNITIAQENILEPLAKYAAAQKDLPSITLTKTGRTTAKKTSKRCAHPATQATTCAPDWKAVHRRAAQRLKLFDRRQVEAFGDSVVPQIPEAIGRAIIRTENAMRAVLWRVP